MLKYVTYLNRNLLTDIYRECGELYNSGLSVIIQEISTELELEGAVIAIEFKHDPGYKGVVRPLDILINEVFGNLFICRFDKHKGEFMLFIDKSVIRPICLNQDDIEYL